MSSSTERASEELTSATSARLERRYEPVQTQKQRIALGLGWLGAAALGAALYAAWFSNSERPWAAALWAVAGLALLMWAVLSKLKPAPIAVGDLGISFGASEEAERVPWCDVQNVSASDDALRIATGHGERRVPLPAHARAAARIVREASLRIGARVDLSPKAHERLPNLDRDTAVLVPAPRPQVTGRRCMASGVAITFEADARWCGTCAALYHREHLPGTCKSCGRSPNAPLAA